MMNPWGSKEVEYLKNQIEVFIEKCAFGWFMLH